MNNALRPARFKTCEEWYAGSHAYQKAYYARNKEPIKAVREGREPMKHRAHVKKRRV
jgi:hypothetical protein